MRSPLRSATREAVSGDRPHSMQREGTMRGTHLVACAAVLAMLVSAPAALAKGGSGSTRLEKLVTVEGVHEHQQALQFIADANGGTRSTRTPGFTASAAYVKSTLEKTGAYNVSYSMFNMPDWEEL